MNKLTTNSSYFIRVFGCALVLLALAVSASSVAAGTGDKKKRVRASLARTEIKEAERKLSEMGYWTGPVDGAIDSESRQALIAFQKVEGRDATGKLTRGDLDAIRNATQPKAKDPGYRHVEVDLDRQVLFMVDDDGTVAGILPVSTGSGQHYSEKGMSGTAYTPRGRFKVYNKASGWKKSPLGMLYFPSYFSDGIAIHGNPDVPTEPKSHGCIRIPMFASVKVSKMLPVGSIVLVYDSRSFVSAKDWAESDRSTQVVSAQ
jgi:L,D-transpeptidase catalytic domain/Putative peptidoglycan binding domain